MGIHISLDIWHRHRTCIVWFKQIISLSIYARLSTLPTHVTVTTVGPCNSWTRLSTGQPIKEFWNDTTTNLGCWLFNAYYYTTETKVQFNIRPSRMDVQLSRSFLIRSVLTLTQKREIFFAGGRLIVYVWSLLLLGPSRSGGSNRPKRRTVRRFRKLRSHWRWCEIGRAWNPRPSRHGISCECWGCHVVVVVAVRHCRRRRSCASAARV